LKVSIVLLKKEPLEKKSDWIPQISVATTEIGYNKKVANQVNQLIKANKNQATYKK